jgi:hypothetical protein
VYRIVEAVAHASRIARPFLQGVALVPCFEKSACIKGTVASCEKSFERARDALQAVVLAGFPPEELGIVSGSSFRGWTCGQVCAILLL